MYRVTSSNLIPLCLLRLLEKYSDPVSPITQEQLGELLEQEYGITCERKALGRTLRRLREELGVDIRQGREGCWLGSRLFTDGELRLLTDLVFSCRSLDEAQAQALADKLASLSSISFAYRLKQRRKQRSSRGVPAPAEGKGSEAGRSEREVHLTLSTEGVAHLLRSLKDRPLSDLCTAVPRVYLGRCRVRSTYGKTKPGKERA